MPRPKKPGAPEPKRRSRNGCWPCKNRKIKCGEEHPSCLNCQKVGEPCDYSIRLNWDGRRGKRPEPESGDSNPDLPSPAVPAKGFKLVHQFPSSTTASGSRRLEPLTPSAGASTGDTTPSASTAAAEASGTPPQSSSDIVRARPSKRVKLSTDAETQDPAEKKPCSSPSSTGDPGSVPFRFAVPSISSAGSPVTPATPSAYSDDDRRHAHTPRADRWPVPSPDIRRMSVHSLLSGPPGPQGPHEEYTSPSSMHSGSVDTHLSYYSSQPRYYGTDRGLPDLDLGKNDDNNAISLAVSPASQCASLATPSGESDYSDQLFPNEFGFGVETNDMTEDAGGYYDKPVQIFIPPHLEPLPPKLLHNPMNLLYFHHFINHTARVLVPYDDPQANPFRTTLPQIAVKNDDLLALVLAYSASHRARVLKHPEPQLRIATWVTDIFPTLRQALSDPQKNFSDANLASAIMLASLEIVSPKVFGYEIPWQKHLSLARELITARPGGLHYQTNFRQDNVCSFLWSWAAYMDVISSLTGGPKDSSTAWMFDYEVEDRSDGYDEIDCIMGFTTRCLYLLAKIADLARLCDAERLRAGCGAVNQWAPSKDQLDQGLKLEKDIKDSMKQAPRPCKHIHTSANLDKWNRVELMATNEAFHWAGLVHIYRRILGRPSEDEDVQTAVSKTIACFDNIRRGGTAEQSLLFPMFTAGCDAREESQRNFLLERFEAGKAHGMTQVRKARKLMMKVWETGQPWETLLSTEFIG